MSSGLFEEAITLYTMFSENGSVVPPGVDPSKLYEQCGAALLNNGYFDKAVLNFIAGGTDFMAVVRLFPDLVPLPLHAVIGVGVASAASGARKLIGAALQKAAAALVTFCDHHRPRIEKRALRAEAIRSSGIIASNSIMGGHPAHHRKGAAGLGSDQDESYISDPEEEIRRAVVLDTVLLSSLVNCFPSRRAAAVELLSSPNRCQIESCSVLLASQGNSYTEALLWLFRSQNQHTRVLQALSEDKCVGVGAWTRDQFYRWAAEYLQWLWYHEEDATLPRQALLALKAVLEYDAEMGLSVLVSRPANASSFGGKGVTIADVLAFLRGVTPRTQVKSSVPFGSAAGAAGKLDVAAAGGAAAVASRGRMAGGQAVAAGAVSLAANSPGVQAVLNSTPLINGHALGVAFLECLVSIFLERF